MDVIFQEHPEVEIGTNKFIDVPTIIQWENQPLMEVVKVEAAGYTTKFSIFNKDGLKIAVVRGAQVYRTEDGKKAKLELRHEPNLTAGELEGNTVFELRRTGAAALKGAAELFAPEGAFIRVNDADTSALLGDGTSLSAFGIPIRNGEFAGHRIAIHATKAGLKIGGEGGRGMVAQIGSGMGAMTIRATGGGGISFLSGDSVGLDAAPCGETYVSHTNSDGTGIVRGAIGKPIHDPPPSADG